MIKENQKLLNQIQVVLDGIVIILAYALSWYIRFRSGIFELDEWYLSLQEYMKWLWGIVPGFLMLYYIFKLYVPKRVLGRRLEAWRILQANIIGVMALIVVLYVIKQPNISRTMPPQLHFLYLIICSLSLCRCYIHIIKFNPDINVIIRFFVGTKEQPSQHVPTSEIDLPP